MGTKHWLDKKPETIKDWLGLACLCIAFYMLAGQVGAFLHWGGTLLQLAAPFGWAVVLAYVLDTLVRPIHHTLFHNRPGLRWAAILIAYLLAGLAVFLLVWLIVPQILASVTAFFVHLPGYVTNMQQVLWNWQDQYGIDLRPVVAALENYEQWLLGLSGLLTGWAPGLVSTLGSLAASTTQWFIILAGSIFMLGDKDHLLHQLRLLVRAFLPRRAARSTLKLCRFANQTFAGFFFGKIVASALIGLALCAVMSLLGLSFAPLISVLVAFANLIPIFGMYIGALPGLIILLFVDPLQALVFLVLVILLQQLDIHLLAPRVLGHASGLSAFWVLFAIVGGAWLWGPAGMVLGVPAFATVYGVVRGLIYDLLAQRSAAEAAASYPGPAPEETPEEEAPPPDPDRELTHVG